MNDRKLFNKRATSYFEIVLLIVSLFAFSYIIYQTDGLIESVSAAEIPEEPVYTYDFNQVLKERLISNFSDNYRCCLENNDGAICQNTVPQYTECKTELLPTKCENTASCKLGCCYDGKEGLCNLNSPKQKCDVDGGEWIEGDKCNLEQCQYGCCIFGENADFVTEQRCAVLGEKHGGSEYKPEIRNELDCLYLTERPATGACVFEGGGCEINTKAECIQKTGDGLKFYENWLCTHPSLDSNCTMTEDTTCVEDKDGVYFVDSCGNKANIYDAARVNEESYWKTVVGFDEVCDARGGNIENSNCGNCVYPVSKCGEGDATYGNSVCVSMDCPDAPDNVGTQDRMNGESWCVYDGYVGDGRDIVGSRHWKYFCQDGEVKVEPCADYRQEICVEGETTEGDFSFTSAGCRVNRWRECIDYNNLAEKKGKEISYEKMQKKCEKNVDCYIKELDFGKNYHMFKCLPKYPPGLQMGSERGLNDDLCGIADMECTKVEIKKLFGMECVSGCECDSPEFTQQMNDFCVSLGDCGGYVNIAGELTRGGYTIDNAPEIDLEQYLQYTNPVGGQAAEPIPLGELIGMMNSLSEAELAELKEGPGMMALIGAQVAKGIVGIALAPAINALMKRGWVANTMTFTEGTYSFDIAKLAGYTPTAGADAIDPQVIQVDGWMGSFGNAAGAALGGMMIGGMVAKMFGLEGDAAFFVSCATGTATLIIHLFFTELKLFGWLGFWAIVIAIVLSLIAKGMGLGEITETIVNFNCYEWEQPTGGLYCDDCGNNVFKTCSGYRCQSLGAACELLNLGTEDERCVWENPNDATPPKISPWEEVLSEGYEYEVSSNGFEIKTEGGECLETFSILSFGVQTDEDAQCKYDTDSKDFEELSFYFGENNYYKQNHSMPFIVPSVQAVASEFNMTYEYALDKLGDINLYLKCQDANGNQNRAAYNIGFCVKTGADETAPLILATSPEDGGYVKYGEILKEASFYLNEPAICKYSLENKDFDLMRGNMSCATGLRDATVHGWKCDAEFNVVNSSKFYIRCKDQPWLAGGVSESLRNENSESFVYSLNPSESELEIDSIEPSGDIEVRTEPASVTLEVVTSGGAESGKATCSFRFREENSWMRFLNSLSSRHEQVFDSMLAGRHEIFIKCEDVAGNIAEEVAKFKVIKDTSSPQVARIYIDGGSIKFITTEEADCKYSTSSCSFDFDDGEDAGTGTVHSVSLTSDTYYIKCSDEHGNIPSGCSVVVRGVRYA